MHTVNPWKTTLQKFIQILIAVLFFGLFFGMLNQGPWAGSSIQDPMGTVNYTENPWVMTQGDTVISETLELPEFMQLEEGKIYTLTAELGYDGSHDELPYGFIHVDHMFCRILCDGEELFSYMPDDIFKWDRSKSAGFVYKAFPLPKDCLGKTLEIELLPPMDTSIEYGLPKLTFGDYSSMVRFFFDRDIPHNIFSVLCALLGFAAILFTTATLTGSNYREGLSIGIFALLFALYLITESKFNYYYTANPYYDYLLNYTVFSLMPVALMGFMRERLPGIQRKICTGVIAAELIFVAAELFLHFYGIADMREMLPVVHSIYFSEVLLVILLLLTTKSRHRKTGLILQFTPVTVGMVIDAFIYWLHLDIGHTDATMTTFGVLVFLVVEIFHFWQTSVEIYTESVRSNLYREMAFVDDLTGAGNRRAYDKEIESINSGEKDYRSLIVVSADSNNLKWVNDHFGHAAGDCLIRSTAQIMMESFGGGSVFRTGGDEFSVFLYDVDIPDFNVMMQNAEEKVAAFNKEKDFTLSLALGYVRITDRSVTDAIREAEKKMYADKAQNKNSRRYREEAVQSGA